MVVGWDPGNGGVADSRGGVGAPEVVLMGVVGW